ncbi:MAG TPA: hypothetical protein VFY48_01320 [Solirubrobacterales bacterium]|nr:hypothetical protein [Solirubrobacterales bacterium]
MRRVRVLGTQPGDNGEEPSTMDMRMDFFDFGATPEIEVPDSDEVFDATDMARDGLDI